MTGYIQMPPTSRQITLTISLVVTAMHQYVMCKQKYTQRIRYLLGSEEVLHQREELFWKAMELHNTCELILCILCNNYTHSTIALPYLAITGYIIVLCWLEVYIYIPT